MNVRNIIHFKTVRMPDHAKISILSRRSFLIAASAAAGLAPLLVHAETMQSTPLTHSKKFTEAFAKLTHGATPVEDKMNVELPQLAENGNFVPITISVESPMTDANYVKAIHLLSTQNPRAHVATFHLTPINAVAYVRARMRLAKTQDVVTLAELSTGELLMATTWVKVTIGGCGD
jgi:sulfur-oxidizing protein SoxY